MVLPAAQQNKLPHTYNNIRLPTRPSSLLPNSKQEKFLQNFIGSKCAPKMKHHRYANEEEGMVSQNTTAIFEGAFYLG
jgi:hypothetical protein